MSSDSCNAGGARRFLRWSKWLICSTPLLLAVACGGSQGAARYGDVIERAEGFSEHPEWADPNHPFTRRGQSVRVLGFVSIAATQKQDVGFRAADSYARAELIRFLNTRIVSVVEENLATNKDPKVSETITASAHELVDDIPIQLHYWERTSGKQGERLQLYSLIDLDQSKVMDLLSRVWSKRSDLRTPLADIQKLVQKQWDSIGNVSTAQSANDLLPSGIYTPDWAKSGDTDNDQAYQLVCYGLASDERQSQALAQRMCTEKLCRLFGVQIQARTTINENLEGLSVDSQVTEGCLNVRVEGRTTDLSGGECGARGCIHWLRQSYPKSAYLAERKRLESPTVVERQVVIQEGDLKYKDPAACESALQQYGQSDEQSASSLKLRLTHLRRAQTACQGIDNRDAGLFTRLTHLLEKPLGTFVNAARGEDRQFQDNYLYASAKWMEDFSTARFLDQRITMLMQLINNALPPIEAFEVLKQTPNNLEAIQKAMKPLYAYPFDNVVAFPTHLLSVHYVHRYRPKGQKDPEFLKFLMREATARKHSCEWIRAVNGDLLIKFLLQQGSFREEEWKAELSVVLGATSSPMTCARDLLEGQPTPTLRRQRTDEMLKLVQNGTLVLSGQGRAGARPSGIASLSGLVPYDVAHAEERSDLVRTWGSVLTGSPEDRKKLAEGTLGAFEPTNKTRNANACMRYYDEGQRLLAQFPEFNPVSYKADALCGCLEPSLGLEASRRLPMIAALAATSYRVCDAVQENEWPGGGIVEPPARPAPPPGAVESRERRSPEERGPHQPAEPYDVARLLGGSIKKCLMDTAIVHPYNGVLSAWVEIKTVAGGAALSQTDVTVRLRSRPRELHRKQGNGWVTASEIRETERTSTDCIRTSASQLRVPADSPVLTSSPRRVWLLYSSEDILEALVLGN